MWIFRSLRWWSGCFTLLFLGWSWWDSVKFESTASWDGLRLVKFRSAESEVELYIAEGADSGGSFFRSEMEAPDTVGLALKSPYFQQGEIDEVGIYIIGIPHWLLIGAASIPWLAVMAWTARQRSRRKPDGPVPPA